MWVLVATIYEAVDDRLRARAKVRPDRVANDQIQNAEHANAIGTRVIGCAIEQRFLMPRPKQGKIPILTWLLHIDRVGPRANLVW